MGRNDGKLLMIVLIVFAVIMTFVFEEPHAQVRVPRAQPAKVGKVDSDLKW
jgi:biopolymer transport protein ExbD